MYKGGRHAGERKDHVREIADRLVAMAESGDLKGAIANTILARRASDAAAPCDTWSFGNRLLAALAGTEDARGYRQWEAAGRHVRKGAKAFYILAPRMVTRTETDEKTGEETKVQVVGGFLAVPVFRFEDTEGEDLVRPDYRPAEAPPLEEVAKAWGIEIQYGPSTHGEYAFHRGGPGAREIIHLSSHDPEVYYHELAHAAHARLEDGNLKGGQHTNQEVVAEFSAAVLAEITGVTATNPQSHLEYMRGYAGDTDKLVRWMLRMLDAVAAAVGMILDAADQAAAAKVEAKVPAA